MAAAGALGNVTVQPSSDKENAGAALVPIEASMQDLKNKGWFTSPKTGMPGTMSKIKMSKTGKHGHAKFTFNVNYPFTNQTSQEMWPGHTHLTRPECIKGEYLVSDYDEGNVSVLNERDEICDYEYKVDFDGCDGKFMTGQEFKDMWESMDFEKEEMWVQILKGPVKPKSKKPYWLCQIVSAQLKPASQD